MKNRVISAVFMIAVLLVCVFLSPVTRILFFAAAAILCAYEYSTQMRKLEAYCSLWVMVVYLLAQAALTLVGAGLGAYCAAFVGSIYLALLSGILRRRVSGNGALDTVAGLTYPCLLFGIIMVIGVSDIWLETLALGCLATWSCDNAAFLFGTRFGKRKLAPAVSPNKTVEGSVSGAVSAIPTGVLVYFLGRWCSGVPWLGSQYMPLPLWLCVVTALAASSMGQLGDLAESLLKRMLDVKDFSDLIPGHGGMFDRADSLLFSIPTAYFCLRLAGVGG